MPRSTATIGASIEVTPMIDVMLVLLVIFMVVAPLVGAGVRLHPPAARHAEPRPDAGETLLVLAPDGTLYLNGAPVDDATAADRLAVQYGGRDTPAPLYFKADRRAAYGRVQQAVELARAAGVRVLAVVTERRPPAGGAQ